MDIREWFNIIAYKCRLLCTVLRQEQHYFMSGIEFEEQMRGKIATFGLTPASSNLDTQMVETGT